MLSREPDLNMTNSEAPNTFQILNLFTNFSVQFSFRFCLLELSSPHSFASVIEIDIANWQDMSCGSSQCTVQSSVPSFA